MGCCGGRRNGARAGRSTPKALDGGVAPQAPSQPAEAGGTLRPPPSRATGGARKAARASLRYGGTTGLTAIGGATGTRYRFDLPGATVEVDPRDLPSLSRVPGLTPLRAG